MANIFFERKCLSLVTQGGFSGLFLAFCYHLVHSCIETFTRFLAIASSFGVHLSIAGSCWLLVMHEFEILCSLVEGYFTRKITQSFI